MKHSSSSFGHPSTNPRPRMELDRLLYLDESRPQIVQLHAVEPARVDQEVREKCCQRLARTYHIGVTLPAEGGVEIPHVARQRTQTLSNGVPIDSFERQSHAP